MRLSFILATAAALILAQDLFGLNLQDFTKCIGPQGQGPVCQLDAGTYALSTQLQLGRSNITIKGSVITSSRDTVLQRAPGWQYGLLIDIGPPSTLSPVSNITIRDLTFDGNKSQNSGPQYYPELSISTTKSLLVTNCNFINSPFISFVVQSGGAAGVVVNNSYFWNAATFGFWTGAPGLNSGETYLTCASLVIPDNIIIANSQFEGIGENAMYLSATDLRLINNVFTDTHSYQVGAFLGMRGGQVDLDQCTDTAAVVGNTFQGGQQGSGDGYTLGLELHGTNMSVVNNLVQNNWDDGIGIGGGADIFIANWDTTSSIKGNAGTGIAIFQVNTNGSERPVDFVTVDHVSILNNRLGGILVMGGAFPANHIAITNNCIEGNAFNPQVNLVDMGPDVIVNNNLATGCGTN